MKHELRNYSKVSLYGYCYTCNEAIRVFCIKGTYYCEKQPLWLIANDPPKKKPTVKRSTHGLTVQESKEFREGKVCAICGSAEKLRVDHCHEIGTIRGVLCNDCNLGLGRFYDSPERLRAAAEYLDSIPSLG